MEILFRENKQLVVQSKGEKSWVRVITKEGSSFASKIRKRTSKGALCDFYDLDDDLVIQVFDGATKGFYSTHNGELKEIKSWEVNKFIPAPKVVEFNIKVEQDDTEFIDKLIDLLNSKRNG